MVRPGPGLRRTLDIPLPGYDMIFHCVCDCFEKAECCIPPSQSTSLVALNQESKPVAETVVVVCQGDAEGSNDKEWTSECVGVM